MSTVLPDRPGQVAKHNGRALGAHDIDLESAALSISATSCAQASSPSVCAPTLGCATSLRELREARHPDVSTKYSSILLEVRHLILASAHLRLSGSQPST